MAWRMAAVGVALTLLGSGCLDLPEDGTGKSAAPRQRPVPLYAGTAGGARIEPGYWAVYEVHAPDENGVRQRSVMGIAADRTEMREGREAIWLEIEVRQDGQPTVVTRCLADNVPGGNGEVHEAIVQVEGYDPFIVPSGWLEADEEQAPSVERLTPPPGAALAPPPAETAYVGGRPVEVRRLEVTDEDGRPMRVAVAEGVPPIYLAEVDGADVDMLLLDFGAGVQSKIHGEATDFWLWVLDLAGKSL